MGVCVMYYLVLVEGGYNPFFVLRELVPLTYPLQPHSEEPSDMAGQGSSLNY